jgi:hypothetical protein
MSNKLDCRRDPWIQTELLLLSPVSGEDYHMNELQELASRAVENLEDAGDFLQSVFEEDDCVDSFLGRHVYI